MTNIGTSTAIKNKWKDLASKEKQFYIGKSNLAFRNFKNLEIRDYGRSINI